MQLPPTPTSSAQAPPDAQTTQNATATPDAAGEKHQTAVAVAAIPAPTGAAPNAPVDLYDYHTCTICIVIHLRRETEEGQPREVVLSVQNGVGNKGDLPLFHVLPETELGGPFPPALEALLEQLRQDLPRRKERHEARKAAAQAVPPRPANTTRQAGKPVTPATTPKGGTPAAKASTTPPPIPTTSTPLPKGELTMGGLFDDAD